VPLCAPVTSAVDEAAHPCHAAFLSISSGGGLTESRKCSSPVLDIVWDGSLWMVQSAEGTFRQFALQPEGGRHFQVAKVNKIFITDMLLCAVSRSTASRFATDHIMDLPTLQHPWLPSARSSLFARDSRKYLPRVYVTDSQHNVTNLQSGWLSKHGKTYYRGQTPHHCPMTGYPTERF